MKAGLSASPCVLERQRVLLVDAATLAAARTERCSCCGPGASSGVSFADSRGAGGASPERLGAAAAAAALVWQGH